MFSNATFRYLEALAANNNRAWFEANKDRYESLVRTPATAFIMEMAAELEKFAPYFRADPRKVGGSLMRVFRDTRFSRDKTPYKTNIGIQFRHMLGKDVHAPGFYVHIASDECFLAAGCWRPEADALGKIRDFIAANPGQWFATRDDAEFTAQWKLSGDSLTRPPRGYAPDHIALDDIKRKSFIAMISLSHTDITAPDFAEQAGARFSDAVPLMRFLCTALNIPY